MVDNSWTKFGIDDPYFAVLTDDKYKIKNLNDQTLDGFFSSGEKHVENLLKTFKNNFGLTNPSFKHALDFGCGTGRLLIPFATRFEKAVGIDISQPMLEEAQKNLNARKLTNVELLQSSDITKLEFSNSFDFVHTCIVLQHIPTNQGYKIIDKLLSLTCNGGYGMIHFTFSNKRSALMNRLASFKNSYYLTRGLWNLLKGKGFGSPFMQMNNYDLEKVFKKLMSHNLKQVLLEFTDHSGHLGICVYFKK